MSGWGRKLPSNLNKLSRFAQLYKKAYIPNSELETMAYNSMLNFTNITYTDPWDPYINP